MISPSEIKTKAERKYSVFLASLLNGTAFFPLVITGDKSPAKSFGAFESEVRTLSINSKEHKGYGYSIIYKPVKTKTHGNQDLPESIYFEDKKDFLRFLGKEKEVTAFEKDVSDILIHFPDLRDWVSQNLLKIIQYAGQWQSIIAVCQYFIANPRPGLYIRELPILIHTKFIEENANILQSLLDVLIPDHIRNPLRKGFAERYYLKHDEPMIRVRILDTNLALHAGITDLAICLTDFNRMDFGCQRVFIAENKMNFLTLPDIPSAIAIWSGGGFNVSYLKHANWLQHQQIFYWGDIDEHGFQILHQLRSYHRHTRSIMMDQVTFDTFQMYCANGQRNRAEILDLLNKDEAALYALLKSQIGKNRLEQEKIDQAYVERYISNL